MKKRTKMTVENQDRNGVRVRVHRFEDGTYVDASCQCFGFNGRCHSTTACPVFKKQQKRSGS